MDNLQNNPLLRPPTVIERFTALLGAGILGVLSFILLVIVLAPIILIGLIWFAIMRWKIKRRFRQMAEELQRGGFGGYPQDDEVETKKVSVRVYDAEDDADKS